MTYNYRHRYIAKGMLFAIQHKQCISVSVQHIQCNGMLLLMSFCVYMCAKIRSGFEVMKLNS